MSVINLELEDDLTALLYQQNQPLQITVREFVVLELYRRGAFRAAKPRKRWRWRALISCATPRDWASRSSI